MGCVKYMGSDGVWVRYAPLGDLGGGVVFGNYVAVVLWKGLD